MTAPTRMTAAVAFAVALLLGPPALVAAHQPAPAEMQAPGDAPSPAAPVEQTPAAPAEHAPAAQGEHAPQGEHAAAEHEAESPFAFPGRLFNFLVLLGGMIYFLKTPLTNYLTSRSEQIRSDLLNAAATRDAATKELAAIDARMRSLPAELDALKARGKEEIAAEQARIKAAADAERQRLVEQARLEIEQQTRAARRDLQHFAATLAVDVARTRLANEMTDADQSRLLERYVAQVKTVHD